MFIKNEYYREYFRIINNPEVSIYYEKHHIIPKSLGGLDTNENLVNLSLEQHYRCHELLPFFTDGLNRKKMVFAWNQMSRIKDKHIDKDLYAKLKIMHRQQLSGSKHHNYKGLYITPFGHLYASQEIYDYRDDITHRALIRWCKNSSKIITKQSVSKSDYLKGLDNVIGKKFSDIGFNFEPA